MNVFNKSFEQHKHTTKTNTKQETICQVLGKVSGSKGFKGKNILVVAVCQYKKQVLLHRVFKQSTTAAIKTNKEVF
jgi:hypothetical protein